MFGSNHTKVTLLCCTWGLGEIAKCCYLLPSFMMFSYYNIGLPLWSLLLQYYNAVAHLITTMQTAVVIHEAMEAFAEAFAHDH